MLHVVAQRCELNKNNSTEKHGIIPIFVFLTFKIHLIAIIKHPKHPLSKYGKNTLWNFQNTPLPVPLVYMSGFLVLSWGEIKINLDFNLIKK